MDLSGAAPIGARWALPAMAPETRVTAVTQVQEQSGSSGAGTDAHDTPEQDLHTASSRDLLALRRAVEDGKRPAGPPPSFDVSILEMDRDLKQILARMEADRAKSRDHDAIQTADEAHATARAADADALRATAEAESAEAVAVAEERAGAVGDDAAGAGSGAGSAEPSRPAGADEGSRGAL